LPLNVGSMRCLSRWWSASSRGAAGCGVTHRPGRDELVDAMVLLLARNSVAQARPGLVERVLGAKRN
jgi:hypothetical protein